ncbi:UvrD-helicase domain-containing protein [Actinomycetaceae bacterium TAE3-ERU4]|nr:UvrD-helicase domain-containing protein [Actinomycetaceae bacterium TAE3-ERU4]
MDTLFSNLGLTAKKQRPAVAASLPALAPVENLSENEKQEYTHSKADDLITGLNPQQAQAVTHTGGPLLVIAGAGSGKTRVLTHRIAYLIATGKARPGEIMAITFTNKAAAEMRERVSSLVGPAANRMWVSTFHSACVRILRANANAAGLKSTFSIYDQADSQRLVSMIVKERNLDTKKFSPKSFAYRISDLKNDLITPEEYAQNAPADPLSRELAKIYPEYCQRLQQANAVDFDDLIMLSVKLLRSHPAIAEHYQRRFRHLLVDEYQDTNHAQYQLVRAISGIESNRASSTATIPPAELTVVGDSDQSIYAFRGATIRNIEEFEKDFPNARTITLEQNYRSTQNILSAANSIIAPNQGRRKKQLWTAHGDGAPIVTDAAESDRDEANFVVKEIDSLLKKDRKYGDIAVFYRTNAQSRALEETLVRNGVPYRVIGGTRFYDRKEIKDAIAYLHVIDNPDDTVSIVRIINTPKRAIGDKTVATLGAHAQRFQVSLGQVLSRIVLQTSPENTELNEFLENLWPGLQEIPPLEELTPRATTSISNFWTQLMTLKMRKETSVAVLLDDLLENTGYLAQLRASQDIQDASRVENLAELHSVALEYDLADKEDTPESGSELSQFLEKVSLVADSDQLSADEGGQVTLMTVHTAKGLEFPVVFVTGMEDGTFPHSRSLADHSELEEERRLAYVAVTRAREALYLTRAATRASWGTPVDLPASRFLADIPAEIIETRRAKSFSEKIFSSGHTSRASSSYSGYGAGTRKNYGSSDDDFAPAFGSGRAPREDKDANLMGATARARAAKKAAEKAQKAGSNTASYFGIHAADRIRHSTYGEGIVLEVTGEGQSEIAVVVFDSGQKKRLMLRYAKVEKI